MISLVPSESWGASSGSGLLPENGVWGHAPPGAFGRAAASPQTRQMRCWPSAAQAAYHSFPSLPPTKTRSLRRAAFFPPKPLRWISAGTLLGAVINAPVLYFLHFCVEGGITYPPAAENVSEQPRTGFISAEKRLSQSGCSAPMDTLFPPAHSAFSALLCGGWYHYPRRALHAVETLDAQELRQRIRRFYAAPVLAPCGQNIPSAGTHATPAPNRAHSGSHAETRGVFTARDIGRVDRVNSLGTLCIVTFGTAQFNEPLAVAAAHHGGNANFA